MRKIIPLVIMVLASCSQAQEITFEQALLDLQILAHDSLEGRRTATKGSEKARNYIVARFRLIGLDSISGSFFQPFSFNLAPSKINIDGVNCLARINGRKDALIVISAHYDHEGVKGGKVYNGADDNASGVAAMLAIAEYFSKRSPQHTLLFAAFDAEEFGLRGSKHFVEHLPEDRQNILLNLNMDMVGYSSKKEIYLAGTFYTPYLKEPILRAAKSSPILRFGHDEPGAGTNNWTFSSDHGSFHQAGIPFLYFGVEDHEHYHRPTDKFNIIDHVFYSDVIALLIRIIENIDVVLSKDE